MRSRRTAYRIATVRKVTAALLVGLAAFAVVRVLAPSAPAGRVGAVVAGHDIPAGAVLRGEDLVVVTRDPADLPSQVLAEPDLVVGQSVTGPVASGEVITSVRLRGRSMLAGQPPGMVAVGIPLGDTSLVGAVHPGDTVTVHTAGAGAQVARGTVLSVRMAEPSAITSQAGSASVVLAVPESDATAIAAALGGPAAGFVLALHG